MLDHVISVPLLWYVVPEQQSLRAEEENNAVYDVANGKSAVETRYQEVQELDAEDTEFEPGLKVAQEQARQASCLVQSDGLTLRNRHRRFLSCPARLAKCKTTSIRD